MTSGNFRAAASAAVLALLAACAQAPAPPPQAATAAPAAGPRALPLDQAVAQLATAMVTRAELPPPGPSGRYPIVIDPWIDRATGQQVATTRLMQAEIERLAPQHFPMLELLPFTPESLARKPLVLLGAISAVDGAGSLRTVAERPGAYRIHGALADLATGRIASQESSWVRPEGVDLTPTAAFRDSPAWSQDPERDVYLRTARSPKGAPVDAEYLMGLPAAALSVAAGQAYEAGDYPRARALYRQAAGQQGGGQLRVLNGLYLTNAALGQRTEAEQAFRQLVGFGLQQGRLAVKFLFRPGSTAFAPQPSLAAAYPMWLREIAREAAGQGGCLLLLGHASPTGDAALNLRLSAARAERVANLMAVAQPALRGRLRTQGMGAQDPIVGTGRDDASDALDRRVEFRPEACRRA